MTIINASDEEITRLNEMILGFRARILILEMENERLEHTLVEDRCPHTKDRYCERLDDLRRQTRDEVLSECRVLIHEAGSIKAAAARIFGIMTPDSKTCPKGCRQGMVLENGVRCEDGSMEPDVPMIGRDKYRCQDCDLMESVDNDV